MLVNLKDILKIAEEKNMAVGGFNALDLATLKSDIAAAEDSDLVADTAAGHSC